MADETGTLALGNVHIDALAMNVVHEKRAAIFFRPTVSEINHHARVRVPPASRVGAAIASVRAFGAGVMDVVTNSANVIVVVRINRFAGFRVAVALVALRLFQANTVMLTTLPLVARSLNHVPEMGNDAGLDEALAVVVEIHSPRIARAFGEDFKLVLSWMIAPDCGIDPLALVFRGARLAYEGRTKHPVTTVKPAVRPPGEGVQRLVRVAFVIKAVQQDFRFAGRLRFGAVLHRDEHQVRRGPDPDSAEADLDAAHQVKVLHKDGAPIELAIAVSVLEHQDAILALSLGLADGIGVAFDDPKPPTVIDAKGDRLFDIRLTRKKFCRKTRRQSHFFGRLLGGKPGEFDGMEGKQILAHAVLGRLREDRFIFIKNKIIEVDVAPGTCLVVGDADEHFLAHIRREVGHDRGQVLGFVARGAINGPLSSVFFDEQLDLGRVVFSARDEEARPTMSDLEGRGGERSLGVVPMCFKSADPVIAMVIAVHVVAAFGNGVALDRLLIESISSGGPVAKRAVLEIEVERLAIEADWLDGSGFIGG